MDITDLGISKLKQGLEKKEYSAVELTQEVLERVEKVDTKVKAFITVTREEALKQAKEVDGKKARGEKLGKLVGIPIGVKDIYLTKGIQSTAGSRVLEGYIPEYSSTVYEKVMAEDPILIGKTNTDTFAFGASTENSGYFVTHNPWNLEMVPGGSSGGSIAAVSAGMVSAGLGSDTGGSIRQPSSLCGVTGIKVTYGRNSRYGITAMASSFDTPGVAANNVEDVALLTEIMAGVDDHDATTSDKLVPEYSKLLNKYQIKGLKIGLPKEYFGEGIEKEVSKKVMEAAEMFRKNGAEVKEISLPNTSLGIDVYYILVPCEISANMARYDGIRFGKSAKNTDKLLEQYMKTRGQFMEPEIKRRIIIGTYALSAGYFDAYYIKASKVRTLIKNEYIKAFGEVDVLLAPVSPTPAWSIGQKANDPLQMYLADVCTVCVNVAGIPSLALPCGLSSNNLPIGFQIMGNYFEEEKLFSVGYQFQKITDFHLKKPKI